MTMKRPARLTAAFVENVERIGIYGDGRGGYGLKLAARNAAAGGLRKMWIQRLTIDGKSRELGLGGYPLVTLDMARMKALENARLADATKPLAAARFAAQVIAPVITIAPAAPAPMPEPEYTITFEAAFEHVIRMKLPRWKVNARGKRSL